MWDKKYNFPLVYSPKGNVPPDFHVDDYVVNDDDVNSVIFPTSVGTGKQTSTP